MRAAWLLLLLAAPASAGGAACEPGAYRETVQACSREETRATRLAFIDGCYSPLSSIGAQCYREYQRALHEVEYARDRAAAGEAEERMARLRRKFEQIAPGDMLAGGLESRFGLPRDIFKVTISPEAADAAEKRVRANREARFRGEQRRDEPRPPQPMAIGSGLLDAMRDHEQSRPAGESPAESGAVDRGLGAAYADLGANADARRALDRALGALPGDPEALAQRGRVNAAEGRWDEAEADARRALERDPENARAREVLALAASYGRGAPRPRSAPTDPFGAAARDDADAGGAGAPGAAAPGAAPARSRGVAVSAAGVDPLAPPGWVALVRAAASKAALADWPGAVLAASKAIHTDPARAAAWTMRAQALNRLRRHAEALKDAEEALRLDPRDARAMVERGIALFELGRNDEALAQLRAALDADPSLALGWLYLGFALEKSGRGDEALAALRKAVELDASLSVLAEPALARLQARPAPPARGRPGPAVALAALAGALLLWGLKRVFRPGWVTSPEPARAGAAAALAPGVVIGGHLRVEKELGRGGMGVVYRALDQALQRPVAVKDLAPAWAGDAELRERLLREARLAARLRHPNLAQIHAVVDEGGAARLVFEYVEGRTLEKVLAERGRIGVPEARALVSQVCAALEHAHGQRVIHRDLKPGNLMLSSEGSVKVLDFGIAHEARGSATQTLTAAWGTPPYMAPEQEAGAVSPASDLYALAVTAYEALTGSRPFFGADMGERKRRRDFAPPCAAAPGLPKGLDAFFARALDPDPRKRPAGAAEFRREFEAALG